MKQPHGYNLELSIGMGEHSRKMLTDFINTLADRTAFERFKKKYERRERCEDGSAYTLLWQGGFEYFEFVQSEMRAIWEGRKKGSESMQLNLRLGLLGSMEDEQTDPPPIRADWKQGSLCISPNTLSDVVWLALLQHSQRLGICENKRTGDCPHAVFPKISSDCKVLLGGVRPDHATRIQAKMVERAWPRLAQ